MTKDGHVSNEEGHENSPDQHETDPLPSRTDEKGREVTESGNERIASPAAWTTAGMTGASVMSTAGVVGGTAGMLVATAVGGGATAAGMVVRRVAPGLSERMGLRKPDRDKDKAKGRDSNRRRSGLSAMGSVGHGGRRRRAGLLGSRGSGPGGARNRRSGLLAGRRGSGQGSGRGRGLLGGRRGQNRAGTTGPGRRRQSRMSGLLGGLAGRRRRERMGSDQRGRRRRNGLLGGLGRRDDRRRGRKTRHGSGGTGHGGKSQRGGLLGRMFNGIRGGRKNNGGGGSPGGKGDKGGKSRGRRMRFPSWLKPDAGRRRKKPAPQSGWETVSPSGDGKTRWDSVDQGKPPSRTPSAGGNPTPTARDIARVADSNSGGIMPNPFESHIESVQATSGSFHVNRAKDLIDWVNHAPEAASAEASAWRTYAHKIQEEIPVNPAFAEALQTYANAQQGLVTQIYEHAAAFRSQHATELAHLEDERPNASKWDQSVNRD